MVAYKLVAKATVPVLLLPAALAAALSSSRVEAATSLTFAPGGLQQGWFEFTGINGKTGTEDIAARLSLTLLKSDAKSFTFGYVIANRTGGDFTGARLFGFGFDLDSDLKSASATGPYDRIASGNMPGFGPVDVCLLAGGNGKNCAQAGKEGLLIGDEPGEGSFTLVLPKAVTALTLSNSFVRWEGLKAEDPKIKGSGFSSGTALEMLPLPEPASWTMMIAGFGLVGASFRRRRGLLARVDA
jgi:hypothetical protein